MSGWEGRRKSLAHFSTVLISPSSVSSLPERQQSLDSGEKITDWVETVAMTLKTILTQNDNLMM